MLTPDEGGVELRAAVLATLVHEARDRVSLLMQ